jgi:hypothetical protein
LYEEKEVHGAEADFHEFEEGKSHSPRKLSVSVKDAIAHSALANAFEKWHRNELSARSLLFRNRLGELHQPAKSLRQFVPINGDPSFATKLGYFGQKPDDATVPTA